MPLMARKEGQARKAQRLARGCMFSATPWSKSKALNKRGPLAYIAGLNGAVLKPVLAHLEPLKDAMKDGIHPNYQETTVTCGCGNTFQTRSVRPELKIDICNQCHPFYTGKLKYVDTAGRIDKFQKKFAAGTYGSLEKKGKK